MSYLTMFLYCTPLGSPRSRPSVPQEMTGNTKRKWLPLDSAWQVRSRRVTAATGTDKFWKRALMWGTTEYHSVNSCFRFVAASNLDFKKVKTCRMLLSTVTLRRPPSQFTVKPSRPSPALLPPFSHCLNLRSSASGGLATSGFVTANLPVIQRGDQEIQPFTQTSKSFIQL